MSIENFEVQYEKLKKKYQDDQTLPEAEFVSLLSNFQEHLELSQDQIKGLWGILINNEEETRTEIMFSEVMDLLDMLKDQTYGADSEDEDPPFDKSEK